MVLGPQVRDVNRAHGVRNLVFGKGRVRECDESERKKIYIFPWMNVTGKEWRVTAAIIRVPVSEHYIWKCIDINFFSKKGNPFNRDFFTVLLFHLVVKYWKIPDLLLIQANVEALLSYMDGHHCITNSPNRSPYESHILSA